MYHAVYSQCFVVRRDPPQNRMSDIRRPLSVPRLSFLVDYCRLFGLHVHGRRRIRKPQGCPALAVSSGAFGHGG